MVNGNQVIFQLGFEGTHGSIAVPTKQIRIASEGFKWVPEKKDEGLLTGGKSTGRVYTMSKKAEGSLSTNVRPDEAGYWLLGTLGVEGNPTLVDGATSAYKHPFTSVSATQNLPSLTGIADRVVRAYGYIGLKVTSLSFSAQPGDYLKMDISFVGKDEVTGTLQSGLVISPLKPFRFSNAAVKVGGVTVADVTSIKFDYNNNLDSSIQTTSTGLYFKEPSVGAREIKTDLEVLYSTESDDIRDDYFKTDDDVALEINFTSDEEIEEGIPFSMKIIVPHNQITDASPANASGAETLKQTISIKAFEEGADELITIELVNAQATKYIV